MSKPKDVKPAQASAKAPAAQPETRIAPDPFAAVLPALAALGAIASIAAVNWVAQDKAGDRPRTKRRPTMALRDLETCCLGLVEIFRRFQRNPRMFAGEGGPASSPMKFGVHGTRATPDAIRGYLQITNDVASMLVLAAQNAIDVMAAIEDGEVEAAETVFFAFGEEQERLNKLFQSRASLKASVDAGAEIADRLTRLVRELKSTRPDAP